MGVRHGSIISSICIVKIAWCNTLVMVMGIFTNMVAICYWLGADYHKEHF